MFLSAVYDTLSLYYSRIQLHCVTIEYSMIECDVKKGDPPRDSLFDEGILPDRVTPN